MVLINLKRQASTASSPLYSLTCLGLVWAFVLFEKERKGRIQVSSVLETYHSKARWEGGFACSTCSKGPHYQGNMLGRELGGVFFSVFSQKKEYLK